MNLTDAQRKVLGHIVRNGDDRAIKQKRWTETKRELWKLGFIKRRIGPWDWVATSEGKLIIERAQ